MSDVKFIRNTDACMRLAYAHLDRAFESLIFGLGVHALNSGEGLTLQEIMDEHIKYREQFPETLEITWSQLLNDLSLLIALGAVETLSSQEK